MSSVRDPILTNPAGPAAGANPAYLNAVREMSTEEEAALDAATEKLDEARWQKVMRMTPLAFAKLSPVERRNYARWAKNFARVMGEKAAMFERNSTPEPELPADLQAKG